MLWSPLQINTIARVCDSPGLFLGKDFCFVVSIHFPWHIQDSPNHLAVSPAERPPADNVDVRWRTIFGALFKSLPAYAKDVFP